MGGLLITFNLTLFNFCPYVLLENMMIFFSLSLRVHLRLRLRVRSRNCWISITICNSIWSSIFSFSLSMRVYSLFNFHSFWRVYNRLKILSYLLTKGFLFLKNSFFFNLFFPLFGLIINHLLEDNISKSTLVNVVIKLMLKKSLLLPG